MHKNWVMKGYDQSVTCLADDPQNLETRNSTLPLRVLYRKQTITYISTQTRSTGKTQIRRSNRKVQLKNSSLQKESNQTEKRNSNCERNKPRLLILD